MGNFTDLPDVRTVELHDGDNHLGMQYLELTAGFCMVDGGNPSTNYDLFGTSSAANVGGNREKSVILKPKPPALTRPNEKCINATLRLWLQEPVDDSLTLSLHRLLKDWVRDEVTWEQAASGDNWDSDGLTAGIDYELTAEVSGTIGDLRGSPYVDFELDTWIDDMCNDGDDNYGFILIATDGSDFSVTFYGEGAVFQQQPVLIVNTAYQEVQDCEADTYIDEADQNTNNGTDALIVVGDPFGADNFKHSLFRFDVDTSQPGMEVETALFFLNINTGSSGTQVRVYPILVPWIETEATWNIASTGVSWATPGLGAGTDYDDSQEVEWVWTNSSNEYISVDITAIVKQWVTGTLTNNGLLVRLPGGVTTTKNVNSRESTGRDPYIELTYRT